MEEELVLVPGGPGDLVGRPEWGGSYSFWAPRTGPKWGLGIQMIKNRQVCLGVRPGLDTHALNLRLRPPHPGHWEGPHHGLAGWRPLRRFWGKGVLVDPP